MNRDETAPVQRPRSPRVPVDFAVQLEGRNRDGEPFDVQAEAGLARNRLERTQGQTSLRALELQVASSVRDAGRLVSTNLKRVEAIRKARRG